MASPRPPLNGSELSACQGRGQRAGERKDRLRDARAEENRWAANKLEYNLAWRR